MKIKVTTHSGNDEDIIEVDSYDPDDMAEKMNDESIQAIAIGNNVYSRIDLKNIKRVDNDEEQS